MKSLPTICSSFVFRFFPRSKLRSLFTVFRFDFYQKASYRSWMCHWSKYVTWQILQAIKSLRITEIRLISISSLFPFFGKAKLCNNLESWFDQSFRQFRRNGTRFDCSTVNEYKWILKLSSRSKVKESKSFMIVHVSRLNAWRTQVSQFPMGHSLCLSSEASRIAFGDSEFTRMSTTLSIITSLGKNGPTWKLIPVSSSQLNYGFCTHFLLKPHCIRCVPLNNHKPKENHSQI